MFLCRQCLPVDTLISATPTAAASSTVCVCVCMSVCMSVCVQACVFESVRKKDIYTYTLKTVSV